MAAEKKTRDMVTGMKHEKEQAKPAAAHRQKVATPRGGAPKAHVVEKHAPDSARRASSLKRQRVESKDNVEAVSKQHTHKRTCTHSVGGPFATFFATIRKAFSSITDSTSKLISSVTAIVPMSK